MRNQIQASNENELVQNIKDNLGIIKKIKSLFTQLIKDNEYNSINIHCFADTPGPQRFVAYTQFLLTFTRNYGTETDELGDQSKTIFIANEVYHHFSTLLTTLREINNIYNILEIFDKLFAESSSLDGSGILSANGSAKLSILIDEFQNELPEKERDDLVLMDEFRASSDNFYHQLYDSLDKLKTKLTAVNDGKAEMKSISTYYNKLLFSFKNLYPELKKIIGELRDIISIIKDDFRGCDFMIGNLKNYDFKKSIFENFFKNNKSSIEIRLKSLLSTLSSLYSSVLYKDYEDVNEIEKSMLVFSNAISHISTLLRTDFIKTRPNFNHLKYQYISFYKELSSVIGELDSMIKLSKSFSNVAGNLFYAPESVGYEFTVFNEVMQKNLVNLLYDDLPLLGDKKSIQNLFIAEYYIRGFHRARNQLVKKLSEMQVSISNIKKQEEIVYIEASVRLAPLYIKKAELDGKEKLSSTEKTEKQINILKKEIKKLKKEKEADSEIIKKSEVTKGIEKVNKIIKKITDKVTSSIAKEEEYNQKESLSSLIQSLNEKKEKIIQKSIGILFSSNKDLDIETLQNLLESRNPDNIDDCLFQDKDDHSSLEKNLAYVIERQRLSFYHKGIGDIAPVTLKIENLQKQFQQKEDDMVKKLAKFISKSGLLLKLEKCCTEVGNLIRSQENLANRFASNHYREILIEINNMVKIINSNKRESEFFAPNEYHTLKDFLYRLSSLAESMADIERFVKYFNDNALREKLSECIDKFKCIDNLNNIEEKSKSLLENSSNILVGKDFKSVEIISRNIYKYYSLCIAPLSASKSDNSANDLDNISHIFHKMSDLNSNYSNKEDIYRDLTLIVSQFNLIYLVFQLQEEKELSIEKFINNQAEPSYNKLEAIIKERQTTLFVSKREFEDFQTDLNSLIFSLKSFLKSFEKIQPNEGEEVKISRYLTSAVEKFCHFNRYGNEIMQIPNAIRLIDEATSSLHPSLIERDDNTVSYTEVFRDTSYPIDMSSALPFLGKVIDQDVEQCIQINPTVATKYFKILHDLIENILGEESRINLFAISDTLGIKPSAFVYPDKVINEYFLAHIDKVYGEILFNTVNQIEEEISNKAKIWWNLLVTDLKLDARHEPMEEEKLREEKAPNFILGTFRNFLGTVIQFKWNTENSSDSDQISESDEESNLDSITKEELQSKSNNLDDLRDARITDSYTQNQKLEEKEGSNAFLKKITDSAEKISAEKIGSIEFSKIDLFKDSIKDLENIINDDKESDSDNEEQYIYNNIKLSITTLDPALTARYDDNWGYDDRHYAAKIDDSDDNNDLLKRLSIIDPDNVEDLEDITLSKHFISKHLTPHILKWYKYYIDKARSVQNVLKIVRKYVETQDDSEIKTVVLIMIDGYESGELKLNASSDAVADFCNSKRYELKYQNLDIMELIQNESKIIDDEPHLQQNNKNPLLVFKDLHEESEDSQEELEGFKKPVKKSKSIESSYIMDNIYLIEKKGNQVVAIYINNQCYDTKVLSLPHGDNTISFSVEKNEIPHHSISQKAFRQDLFIDNVDSYNIENISEEMVKIKEKIMDLGYNYDAKSGFVKIGSKEYLKICALEKRYDELEGLSNNILDGLRNNKRVAEDIAKDINRNEDKSNIDVMENSNKASLNNINSHSMDKIQTQSADINSNILINNDFVSFIQPTQQCPESFSESSLITFFKDVLIGYAYSREINEIKNVIGADHPEINGVEVKSMNCKTLFLLSKKIKLKIHPDKNGGKPEATANFKSFSTLERNIKFVSRLSALDTVKVLSLKILNDISDAKNGFMQTVEYKLGITQSAKQIIAKFGTFASKATTMFKAADLGIDSVRLISDPSIANVQKIGLDATHLYSSVAGVNYISIGLTTINSLSIGISTAAPYWKNGEYGNAALHGAKAATGVVVQSAAYMAIPIVLTWTNPMLGSAYIGYTAAYTGYHTFYNGYVLYNELTNSGKNIVDNIKYLNHWSNINYALSWTILQFFYDFKKSSDFYEKEIKKKEQIIEHFNNVNEELLRIKQDLYSQNKIGIWKAYSDTLNKDYYALALLREKLEDQSHQDNLVHGFVIGSKSVACSKIKEMAETQEYKCYEITNGDPLGNIIIDSHSNIIRDSSNNMEL